MSSTDNPKDNVDWVNNYTPMDLTNPETPHDRVLVVGETKFYVIADHLSVYSEYFQTMFNSDFKEKDQKEIEIKDVDAEEFHSFLKLLHPRKDGLVTKENYLQLVSYSHRFLAREVFAICEDFVLANFDSLDKIDLLKLAFEYNWTILKEKLSGFIRLQMAYCCDKNFRSNCSYCEGHRYGPLLNANFFVINDKDKLAALPAEVQLFVYQNLLKNA